jgi:hypothetical protein
MKPKNFRSTTEMSTCSSPHQMYQDLAVDAVLLHFNDQLPSFSDEENQRILDAAQVAAETVLGLAHVPNDWLSFLEALRSGAPGARQAKLRAELKDLVYDSMPAKDAKLSEDQQAALEGVRRCCTAKSYHNLTDAMFELDQAYGYEQCILIEQAFTLGYQIAHDPTRLLFEVSKP